jgi:hypothetical protein
VCGRYTLKAPREAIAEAFDLAEVPQLLPRYNIAPTQAVLVCLCNIINSQYVLSKCPSTSSPVAAKQLRPLYNQPITLLRITLNCIFCSIIPRPPGTSDRRADFIG